MVGPVQPTCLLINSYRMRLHTVTLHEYKGNMFKIINIIFQHTLCRYSTPGGDKCINVYFPDDILNSSYSYGYNTNKCDNQRIVHMHYVPTQSITLCPAGNYLCTNEKDVMVIFTRCHGSSELYIYCMKIF